MKRVPSGELHHLVDDLLGRLADDRAPADRAVRLADARPQQAQVVVDLGDRADRRARVARGRLLVDRDRRREALDRVDVGLVHLAEELARVGRQRLDVAALALGVDRVEREARLARAGQPGDHDQRVPRQRQRDVLEVVLARPRRRRIWLPAAICRPFYDCEQMFARGRFAEPVRTKAAYGILSTIVRNEDERCTETGPNRSSQAQCASVLAYAPDDQLDVDEDGGKLIARKVAADDPIASVYGILRSPRSTDAD